jgi:hypothetical protein
VKANKQLATYLNNHLAASVTALELLSSLETSQDDREVAHFAGELRAEIEAEQQQLENLMERLRVTQSKPRQAVGWIAERFAQIKLRLDDSSDGPLHLLESFELILIAIEGKRGLWRALAVAAIPGLPITDYERYAQRSEAQQARVEAMRLAAAKAAFSA